MSGSELALGAQSCRNGDCANRERGLPQHRVVPHGQEKAWQFQVGAKRRLEQVLKRAPEEHALFSWGLFPSQAA